MFVIIIFSLHYTIHFVVQCVCYCNTLLTLCVRKERMCVFYDNVCFYITCYVKRLLLLYFPYTMCSERKIIYALTFKFFDKHEQKSCLKIYSPNLTHCSKEDA